MARRRSRSMTRTQETRGRVAAANANRPGLHAVFSLPERRRLWTPVPLLPVEDNRTWHPSTYARPIRRLSGSSARLKVSTPSRTSLKPPTGLFLPHGVGFRDASRVVLCVRRKQRKEVLHALGRAGRRVRRPTYRANSLISCR